MRTPFILDAFLKIQLFRSLNRYSILVCDSQSLSDPPLWRTVIRLKDTKSGQVYDGMGEGASIPQSKLKALAEAYERLCLQDFSDRTGVKLDKRFPFGIGVGLRRKSAILRAYGEYWERRSYLQNAQQNSHDNATESSCIQTPYGRVFVCRIVSTNSQIGTGYGLTNAEAKDSAERSALRKRDFPQDHPQFIEPLIKPTELNLTPTKAPWLECFAVGTQNQINA